MEMKKCPKCGMDCDKDQYHCPNCWFVFENQTATGKETVLTNKARIIRKVLLSAICSVLAIVLTVFICKIVFTPKVEKRPYDALFTSFEEAINDKDYDRLNDIYHIHMTGNYSLEDLQEAGEFYYKDINQIEITYLDEKEVVDNSAVTYEISREWIDGYKRQDNYEIFKNSYGIDQIKELYVNVKETFSDGNVEYEDLVVTIGNVDNEWKILNWIEMGGIAVYIDKSELEWCEGVLKELEELVNSNDYKLLEERTSIENGTIRDKTRERVQTFDYLKISEAYGFYRSSVYESKNMKLGYQTYFVKAFVDYRLEGDKKTHMGYLECYITKESDGGWKLAYIYSFEL